MKHGLIAAVITAAGALAAGTAPGSDRSQAPSTEERLASIALPLASAGEVNDYFGPLALRSFDLRTGKEGKRVGSLLWLESGFSAYDIAGNSRLADDVCISAQLTIGDRTVHLLGQRDGASAELAATTLLFGRDDEGLTSELLLQHLKLLNEFSRPFGETVSIKAEGPDGMVVTLSLLASDLPSSESPIGTLDLRPLVPAHDALQVWTGGYSTNGTTLHLRVATLALPANATQPAAVGVATLRFADRRFDGPVAPGSPWPDRRAMGQVLSQIADAGVPYWEGEFNDRAAEILRESTGRNISKEEFHRILHETFGDLRSAFDVSCHLPEVQHTPLVGMPADSTRLIGLYWAPAEVSPTGRLYRSRLYDLARPDPNAATVFDLKIGRVKQSGNETLTFSTVLAPCRYADTESAPAQTRTSEPNAR